MTRLDGGILSKPGCVLASPSYPQNLARVDQDYVHHWTRDGAIAAIEIANNPVFLNPDGSSQELCDYVAFSKICQDNAAAPAFYRAAYRIDGTLRDWTDQKDGPGLQNLAFIQAQPRLNAAAPAMAKEIAQRNLERIVADWNDDTNKFNPWEEVNGPSFFARSAQLRCLQEVQSTNALELTVPANLAGAITGLSNALDTQVRSVLRSATRINNSASQANNTCVRGSTSVENRCAPAKSARSRTKTPMSSGRSSRVIRVTAREAEEGRMCNVLVADRRVVTPSAGMREHAATD